MKTDATAQQIRPAAAAGETAAAKPAGAVRGDAAGGSRAVLVLLAAVFMSLLDVFIVNVAFPAIGRHFVEADTARLSWMLNGYTITFAALLIPAGRWADRTGRKRAFLTGLVVFTAASAACAAAPSVWALITARVVQAAGAALLSPAAMGLLLAGFPVERRSLAVALFAAVGGVAATLGGPAGGLLTQLSWHWVFLVNVPIGLAALFAGTRVLREVRESAGGPRADLFGALLLAMCVGDAVLVIVKGGEWGWNSARVAVGALAAIVLGGWFVGRARWHPAPVVELPMLRERTFAAANLAGLLFAGAFGAMILANVLFITQAWRPASWLLGLQMMPGPLTAAALALPAGKLCLLRGPRVVAVGGAVFFALGNAWWVWRLGAEASYAGDFLPGTLLVGAGIGLSLPSVTAAAVAALPAARLSTGSAVLNMSRQIGTALGVALLVAIIGGKPPPDLLAFKHAYVVTGALALGSGLAALSFIPPRIINPKNANEP